MRASVALPSGNRYVYLYQVPAESAPELPLALKYNLPRASVNPEEPEVGRSRQAAPSLVSSSTSLSIEPESSSAKMMFGLAALRTSSGVLEISMLAVAACTASQGSSSVRIMSHTRALRVI